MFFTVDKVDVLISVIVMQIMLSVWYWMYRYENGTVLVSVSTLHKKLVCILYVYV